MQFELQMNCDNPCFQNGWVHAEVAKILHEVAGNVLARPSDHGWWQTIVDAAGNDIGRYRLSGGPLDTRSNP